MIGIFFALVFATWPSWAVFTSGKAQTKFATSYAAAPHQLWWAQGGEERGSSDHEKTKESQGFKGWLMTIYIVSILLNLGIYIG